MNLSEQENIVRSSIIIIMQTDQFLQLVTVTKPINLSINENIDKLKA